MPHTVRTVTKRAREWHVRRQRPNARTTILWFIDANADRMSVGQVIDDLASEASFRALFLSAVAETDARSFVLETPCSNRSGEFECALTEAPPAPKKAKIDPATYAAHFGAESVAVFESPDGNGTLVVPAPKQVEGWYCDLATFLRRIDAAQQDALIRALAQTAKKALATQAVCLSSSAPGAPWLSMRVGTSSKGFLYGRYAR